MTNPIPHSVCLVAFSINTAASRWALRFTQAIHSAIGGFSELTDIHRVDGPAGLLPTDFL